MQDVTPAARTAAQTVVQGFYDALAQGDVRWTEAEHFPYYSGTWIGPQAVLDKLHDVATVSAALVNAPQGRRAPRTVAGGPFGADAVNQSTAPVQAEIVKGLGLAHLDVARARP